MNNGVRSSRRHSRRFKRIYSRGPVQKIRSLHRKLWAYFNILKSNEEKFADPPVQACVAVLEEDLSALLDECEDYMIPGLEPEVVEYSSFETRSETVIEEVDQILSGSRLKH